MGALTFLYMFSRTVGPRIICPYICTSKPLQRLVPWTIGPFYDWSPNVLPRGVLDNFFEPSAYLHVVWQIGQTERKFPQKLGNKSLETCLSQK